MPISWSPRYATGIEEIDAQHRALLELVNKVQRGAKDSGVNVPSVLDELVSYAEVHFRGEEALFSRTDYPEQRAHHAAHVAFVRKLLSLQQRLRAGEETVLVELCDFLGSWWDQHILQEDQRYVPHLREHGAVRTTGTRDARFLAPGATEPRRTAD